MATALHPLLVDLYTNGWCPFFACALVSLDPSLELVETEEDCWHVAALDSDGYVWDVTGRTPLNEFEDIWGKTFPVYRLGQMAELEAAGDWEAFARYFTSGNEWGEPPESAWEITCGLAAEVLAGGQR